MAVALNIDIGRQLRTTRQLGDLLTAIDAANSGDESYFVEWKSTLDLETAAGRFHVAKCILGMGNRPVRKATQYFEGCAYMVVGMEPGNAPGIAVPDYEKLQPWIETYTGSDGPDWTPHQVTFKGVTVLVIIVEPPRDNDHIHTLQKTYQPSERTINGKKVEKGHQEGAVLVRHLAKTEPANTNDVRELEKRLLAGQAGVPDIGDVTVTPIGSAQVINLTQDAVNARYAAEVEALALLEPPFESSSIGRIPFSSILGTLHPDEDERRYERERTKYLDAFKNTLKPYAIRLALRQHPAPFFVEVRNDSRTALNDVEVRVEIAEDLSVFGSPDEYDVELPKRPSAQPKSAIPGLGQDPAWQRAVRRTASGSVSFFTIAENRRSVTFIIRGIHPGRTERTDSVLLLAGFHAVGAGNLRSQRWDLPVSITAGNRADVWHASVSVGASPTVLADERLLPPDPATRG